MLLLLLELLDDATVATIAPIVIVDDYCSNIVTIATIASHIGGGSGSRSGSSSNNSVACFPN